MSQSLAETHVENLIYECDCITAGDYGESTQEHIDDLMLKMEGFPSRSCAPDRRQSPGIRR